MVRVRIVAVAILAATIAGCSSEPPVVQEAKKINEPVIKAPELKVPAKPAKDEDAAAALVKDCLSAHSAGKPELIAKLKSCSYSRSGLIEMAGGRIRSTWKIQLLWPERYRVQFELQGSAISTTTFGKYPGGLWQYPGGPDKPEKGPIAAEMQPSFEAQLHEDSLSLLFLLNEPGTIVARASDEKIDGVELLGLHLWSPTLEYALVGIDKSTKLLRRIVYNGRELSTPVVKELFFSSYQEFDGIKLGTRLLVKGGGRALAEWTEMKLDSKAAIDPASFEKP